MVLCGMCLVLIACMGSHSVNDLFDVTAEDKESTELGSKGYIKRKKQAEQVQPDHLAPWLS